MTGETEEAGEDKNNPGSDAFIFAPLSDKNPS